MPFSTSYASGILNYLFARNTGLTSPNTVYIGLSSNDPEADSGTFTELSGGAYARVAVASKGDTFPNYFSTTSDRTITNNYQITFTKATSAWTTAKGFGLFSASTGGTPFYYGKLDVEVTVPAEAVALFEAGALKITISDTDEATA